MATNRQEEIQRVEYGLTELILHCKQAIASKQYVPSCDPDEDENEMREAREFLATLRRLREEFENAVTGIL